MWEVVSLKRHCRFTVEQGNWKSILDVQELQCEISLLGWDIFQVFKYCSRISTSAADLCNIGLNASLHPKRRSFSPFFFCCLFLFSVWIFAANSWNLLGRKFISWRSAALFFFFFISKKEYKNIWKLASPFSQLWTSKWYWRRVKAASALRPSAVLVLLRHRGALEAAAVIADGIDPYTRCVTSLARARMLSSLLGSVLRVPQSRWAVWGKMLLILIASFHMLLLRHYNLPIQL